MGSSISKRSTVCRSRRLSSKKISWGIGARSTWGWRQKTVVTSYSRIRLNSTKGCLMIRPRKWKRWIPSSGKKSQILTNSKISTKDLPSSFRRLKMCNRSLSSTKTTLTKFQMKINDSIISWEIGWRKYKPGSSSIPKLKPNCPSCNNLKISVKVYRKS